LVAAGNIAIFHVGDAAVNEGVAEDVRDAEGVWPRPHAAAFDEVVVGCAGDVNPIAVTGLVFELGDGVAVVANLNGRPPLVAAVFEMVNNRPFEGIADLLPAYGNPPLVYFGNLGKRFGTHVNIPVLAFGTHINNADNDAALGAGDGDISPAEVGIAELRVVHGGVHEIAGYGWEEARAGPGSEVVGSFTVVGLAERDDTAVAVRPVAGDEGEEGQ